jgi:hypothetical protein
MIEERYCDFCDAEATWKIIWEDKWGILNTYMCETHYDAFAFGHFLEEYSEESLGRASG